MGCLLVEHFQWLHYAVFFLVLAAGMVWHRMKQWKTQSSICYTLLHRSLLPGVLICVLGTPTSQTSGRRAIEKQRQHLSILPPSKGAETALSIP